MAAAVLLAVTISVFAALPAAAAGRPPGGNFSDPAIRSIDIAEPAIVRVATLYHGTITFDICGQADTLPSGGKQITFGGLGSGAFISANGDILTADHVVDIAKADLDQTIFQALAQQIADLFNANASCLHLAGYVTANDISYDTVSASGIPFTTAYSPPQYLVWQNTTYTGPITNGLSQSDDLLKALMAGTSLTATLEGTSSFTQNDVALLHVPLTDTPSVPLGNSDNVAVEDHLAVIGFPGNADANHPDATYDTSDLVTPTVTNLTVTAIKTNDDGESLIQVSGGIEHGDSGGPAIDVNGNLVGIVSYSGSDDPIGNFFLRSSNSAHELITGQGIDTRPGTFEKLWQQAFMDYASTASGHWHTASQELDALSARYPNFQGILPYKHYADQAALTESTFGSGSNLVVIVALGVALLALVILVIVLLLMRRRRKQQAQQAALAPAAAPNPYGSYGPYGPYGSYGGYGSYPPGYGPSTPQSPYGYGGYGPQSQGIYRPTLGLPAQPGSNGAANGAAGTPAQSPTPVAMSNTPAVLDAQQMRDLMAGAPMGQMPAGAFNGSNPPAQRTPSAPSNPSPSPLYPQDGYAGPGAGGTNGSSGLGAPNVYGHNGDGAATGGGTTATPRRDTCVNGHAMTSNEQYCPVCGMPRASDNAAYRSSQQ
jgi:S1-C subfamily serine protease